MKVEFTYAKKEWIQARRTYLWLSKTISKSQIFSSALVLVILVYYTMKGSYPGLLILLAFLWFLSICAMFYLYIIQPIYFFDKTEIFHSPNTLIFNEDEIRLETLGFESDMDGYDDFKESKTSFYLLHSKSSYEIIPKRVFSTKEEVDQFRAVLESYRKD